MELILFIIAAIFFSLWMAKRARYTEARRYSRTLKGIVEYQKKRLDYLEDREGKLEMWLAVERRKPRVVDVRNN